MFDMKKNVLFNFVVFVVALSCFTNCSPENDGLPASEDPVTLSIVDKQATSETKALLANLWDIQKKRIYVRTPCRLLHGSRLVV